VSQELSANLDKRVLFEAMLDSPLAEYIPSVLHSGSRDFVVDVFNSCSNDGLLKVLMKISDKKTQLLSDYREKMKTELVWPMNRRATPMPNRKRDSKMFLKRPKTLLEDLDGARGICAAVL
jgi:hypothetical protein